MYKICYNGDESGCFILLPVGKYLRTFEFVLWEIYVTVHREGEEKCQVARLTKFVYYSLLPSPPLVSETPGNSQLLRVWPLRLVCRLTCCKVLQFISHLILKVILRWPRKFYQGLRLWFLRNKPRKNAILENLQQSIPISLCLILDPRILGLCMAL